MFLKPPLLQFRSLFMILDQLKYNQEGSFMVLEIYDKNWTSYNCRRNILQERNKCLKRGVQRSPESLLISSEAGARVGTCKEIWKLGMSGCKSWAVRKQWSIWWWVWGREEKLEIKRENMRTNWNLPTPLCLSLTASKTKMTFLV